MALVELGESSLDVIPSIALVASAPARASSDSSPPLLPEEHSIDIPDESFDPQKLTVMNSDLSHSPREDALPPQQTQGDADEISSLVVVQELEQTADAAISVASISWESESAAAQFALEAAAAPEPVHRKPNEEMRDGNDVVKESDTKSKDYQGQNDTRVAEVPATDPSDGKNAVNSLPQESSAGAVQHKMGVRTHARLLSGSRPSYPEEAVRNGLQGRVILEITIDQSGCVTDARIVKSSRHRILDDEAMKFAKTVQFEAATLDGNPVVSTVLFPISFSLHDG
ncbi:energy transducer TonB [bacterium]|nr:energy transducer TonB [bacterium]